MINQGRGRRGAADPFVLWAGLLGGDVVAVSIEEVCAVSADEGNGEDLTPV